MIEAVIFDLDGVLIDSAHSVRRVRTRLLAEYGIDFTKLPDPHGEQHRSSSLKDFLLAAQAHHPDIRINKERFMQDQIRGVYADLRQNRVPADPALLRFLDELQEHTIPCAIASVGVTQGVENKLQILGIKKYFKVIVTADDVAVHKPDPAAYILAAKRLGVDPRRCVVFEDSEAGAKAGTAAGSSVVGFTKYSNKKEPLPDTMLTIDGWEEINLAWLNELTAFFGVRPIDVPSMHQAS